MIAIYETLDAHWTPWPAACCRKTTNERADKIKQLQSFKGILDKVNAGKFFLAWAQGSTYVDKIYGKRREENVQTA